MLVRDDDDDDDDDNDVIRTDSWNLMRLHSDISNTEMNYIH